MYRKHLFKVSPSVVNNLTRVLEYSVDNYSDSSEGTCTVNGYQTENVINLINPDVLSEIKSCSLVHVNNMAEDYAFDDILIDYVHIIKYNVGGYQTLHNHYETEDMSFIIHLSDTTSATVFKHYDYEERITGKVGDMLVFNSCISHYGDVVKEKKVVAVGSIKIINKKWLDRSIK